MADYQFEKVLVHDILPGGGVRVVRGGTVDVLDWFTGDVISQVTADASGHALVSTTDVGVIQLRSPQGFLSEPIVAPELLVAAAVFGVSEDSAVAALVADGGSASRTALNDVVAGVAYQASNFGVTANGATDDRLKMLDALNAGRVIVLPKGGTIRLAAKLVIPAGRTIITNGCKFTVTSGLNDYALQVGTGTTIVGGLTLTTPTGTDVRGVEIVGDDITIDRLTVTAASAAAGAGDINDCGLSIRDSNRVSIGQTTITNFDYAAQAKTSTDVDLGQVRITTYVRGIYLSDVKGFDVRGRISGASPNAIVTPGHNGLLIDALSNGATSDINVRGLTVSDCGEHGFRVGGAFTVKRVRFSGCAATNVGASGFKILGDSVNKHEDFTLTDCVAEDCGQSGTNSAGFMLQYVRRLKVNGGIVRKNAKTYSASEGFNIQGADSVSINDPDISDTAERAYAVLSNLGNNTNVRLNGGRITITAGVGVSINYTNFTFRRVTVEGYPQIEPSSSCYAVQITNTGGTGAVTGAAWVTWQSVAASTLQIDPASTMTGYFCDVRAPFVTSTFKNGSTWFDSSASVTYRRSSGQWFALGAHTSGTGSPEGVVTAPVGTIYARSDGGAGTTLYIKESGTGNTGWISK